MKLRTTRSLCKYWQAVLNLPEWTIKLRRPEKDECSDAIAWIYWSPEELTATLVMRAHAEEDSLVHELLHLVLDGHKNYASELYSELHERSINRITASLIALNGRA
jgi:hypothetical protein